MRPLPAGRRAGLRRRAPSLGGPRTTSLLAASAVALVLTHWLRLLPLGYQAPGETRYEDFVDLLTPYVVAGPLLVVLARVRLRPAPWAAALVGAAMFVQGHGVHLSANSISYAQGSAAPTYLWDEVVGHALWFVGLSILIVVVVHAVRSLPLPVGSGAWGLSIAVGVTWAANVVEAGHAPLGVALAVGLCGYGWRGRERAPGRLLAATFALSLVLVAAYGLWQQGFPQPSELGWL